MIIGLTGLAGSGKDTFCKLYQEQHPTYRRIGFADKIREALLALNPIVECDRTLSEVVERKGWDAAKRENYEVRRLLQVFGTEVGRNLFGKNVMGDTYLRSYGQFCASRLDRHGCSI